MTSPFLSPRQSIPPRNWPSILKLPTSCPTAVRPILDAVAAQGATLEGVDCFVARCGGLQPCEGGVYAVTDKVVADCFSGYTVHPAILGGKLAQSFAEEFGGTALLLNPPDTDEFQDVARVTGLHDVYRTSNVHMLNQKETAIRAAAELGKKYEDCNFVVAHIGGGVSVTAHRKGKAVDSNSIIMGEGPMTPTRAGALPAIPFMDLCYSGKWTRDEMYDRLIKSGGFVDLLGTSEATDVTAMIDSGKYDAIIVDCVPPATIDTGEVAQAMVDILKSTSIPIFSCFFGPDAWRSRPCRDEKRGGIPTFSFPDQMVRTMRYMVQPEEAACDSYDCHICAQSRTEARRLMEHAESNAYLPAERLLPSAEAL